MDQLMALGMQVHSLRGHITGDEHAYRRTLLLERFDDTLLLVIRKTAVHDRDSILWQAQILRQMFV